MLPTRSRVIQDETYEQIRFKKQGIFEGDQIDLDAFYL